MIRTKKLCKSFGDIALLKDIELEVKTGRVYGLLGPNGAGKSTLLKLLVGAYHPTSGEVLINDQVLSSKNIIDIGAMIEGPSIYDNLTAKENLGIIKILASLPSNRVDEVLSIVGLTDTGKKPVKKFSLGMKQRLGIAMTLMRSPKLLILDEPTNGLDPIAIKELRELILSLKKSGMTIIVSSHILSEIQHIADDIGIIIAGKLCYQGVIDKDKNDLEQLFINITKAAHYD